MGNGHNGQFGYQWLMHGDGIVQGSAPSEMLVGLS